MPRPPKATKQHRGAVDFGKALAKLRKARGYTQVELAEKVDSLQVVLSEYERDKNRPNADMIVRLARALEVSTDELLGLSPPDKTKSPSPNRRLLRRMQALQDLPKRDQDALLRTIDAFLGKAS